jgi:hypothetical protein
VALFTNLYHVGEALAQLLSDRLELPINRVIVGLPREEPTNPVEQLRVSLLWVNQQPGHVSDAPHRNFNGTETPAPMTLSAFYLITTYGNTTEEIASDAHRLLGDVLRVFHAEPVLRLSPGLGHGEGKLGVTLVPTTPELLEKIFSPLQLKHRPFLLYEVGPVQLKSLKETIGPRPVVAPDGLALGGPEAKARPSIGRVVPMAQAVGGRVRIDGSFEQAPSRVWIGPAKIEGADITVVDAKRSVVVLLPALGLNAVPPGVHKLSVAAGNLISEPASLLVLPMGEAALEAPAALTHSKAAPLVLAGRGLAGALDVVAWPDDGIRDPSDVKTLPIDLKTDVEVHVGAASLKDLGERMYRLAARVGPHVYTPYVVLEVTP